MKIKFLITTSLITIVGIGYSTVLSANIQARLKLNNNADLSVLINLGSVNLAQKSFLENKISSPNQDTQDSVVNFTDASYTTKNMLENKSEPVFSNNLKNSIIAMPPLDQANYGCFHDFADIEAIDILSAYENPAPKHNTLSAIEINENEDTYNVSYLPGLQFYLDLEYYYDNCQDQTKTDPFTYIVGYMSHNGTNDIITISPYSGGEEYTDFQVIKKYGLVKSEGLFDQNRSFRPMMPGSDEIIASIYNPTSEYQPAYPAPTANPTKQQVKSAISKYKAMAVFPSFKINNSWGWVKNNWFKNVKGMDHSIQEYIKEGTLIPIEINLYPSYPYLDYQQYQISHKNNPLNGPSNVGMIGKYYINWNATVSNSCNWDQRNPNVNANLDQNIAVQDVWASTPEFDSYAKTVTTNQQYANDESGHAVLVVGYINNANIALPNGQSQNTTLYIIKNSWGMLNGDYSYNFVTDQYLYKYGTMAIAVSK